MFLLGLGIFFYMLNSNRTELIDVKNVRFIYDQNVNDAFSILFYNNENSGFQIIADRGQFSYWINGIKMWEIDKIEELKSTVNNLNTNLSGVYRVNINGEDGTPHQEVFINGYDDQFNTDGIYYGYLFHGQRNFYIGYACNNGDFASFVIFGYFNQALQLLKTIDGWIVKEFQFV